ncbi:MULTISPECIES: matrixin family metalloprotease [Microbacterium]|uniref:Matrixin n=1 Tax=Microbacterium kyungheense TaxID=1263636 RepID=A0A543F0L9_9MICO|nr:matrixin family metalloprotease [Microbacterium kyungheense]TQM27373.1 matrixin [Microbacterium kyungheense]
MHIRRWRRKAIAAAAGFALISGSVLFSASSASAYTLTGCSWGPYGTTVTWQLNAPAGDYYDTGLAAGYSWAATTDINGMSPNNGLLVGYLDNKGANMYSGWTDWQCNGNKTVYANATLNPYYTNGYSYANKKKVWLHELGHGLGLNHSGSYAIMYTPVQSTGFTQPQPDDISGINSLY